MAKKLNVSTRSDRTFGEFARGYRQSSNVEDKRDGRGFIRAVTNEYGFPGVGGRTNTRDFMEGRPKQRTDTTPSRSEYNPPTPDDDVGEEMRMLGGSRNTTTPSSSTRKVDAEEAVRKTHFERN